MVASRLASKLVAGTRAKNRLKQPGDWFRSKDGRSALKNVLSWHTEHEDRPKNIDTTRKKPASDTSPPGTFENGVTTKDYAKWPHQ